MRQLDAVAEVRSATDDEASVDSAWQDNDGRRERNPPCPNCPKWKP